MTSDRFVCADFRTLFSYIAEFEKTGMLFGIPSELFFTPDSKDPFRVERYGQTLETPLGVAAGPHTQLSQNIITAWLTGARYMELKTVQVLDELDVTKPCIDMSDEGYNCEWSQELKLDRSFDEYLNAWVMLHVLKNILGHDMSEAGFIFNMSVGYNMEGILSPSVQTFLDRMQDASDFLDEKIDAASEFYPEVKKLNIPAQITNNITVSTMHGCPPEEVEKIGRYFIEERKLDTTIKLNPTLLGAEKLRDILNGRLGFDVEVPDLAFDHDLKYEQGVELIKSLTKSSEKSSAAFNLKLTNTLETSNILQKLPKNEQMVYMSGRALHPISINVADRLQREFGGELDISFSAGADCFNICDILACGLSPVTVCSDILKPGGYGRLAQYIKTMRSELSGSVDEHILKTSGMKTKREAVLANLNRYADEVAGKEYYTKQSYPYDSVKTGRKLGFFDCASAPCTTGCPAGQEIPRYLDYTAKGDFENAYRTIIATNPFPNVQGRVCDHLCQAKCTRINYEKPLLIREVKRYIAERFENTGLTPEKPNGIKVSVIGAGPAGLSCAHYLALAGFQVEVYEAKGFAGGMAADGIPVFRLDDGSLEKDISNIRNLGVQINFDTPVTPELFDKIRQKSSYVYIAVGAQKSLPLGIPGEDAEGVYDQLSFLSDVRRGVQRDYGSRIIVIGAGNSAMDAARTAKRLIPEGEVTIVYRRTRREMPCDIEEIRGALEEGVRLAELASPVSVEVKEGRVAGLRAAGMTLGEPDESGRRRPVPDGSEYTIDADTIIPAIGQQVELSFYPGSALNVNPVTYETDIENIFAGGDAYRGASSLINAIADGQKAAVSIMSKEEMGPVETSPADMREPDYRGLMLKQAERVFGPELPEKKPGDRLNFELFMSSLSDADAVREAERCLQCDLYCGVCTTVCPNRSNIAIETGTYEIPQEVLDSKDRIWPDGTLKIAQPYQIINIGDFCNECGNCTTFCPTSGRPYMDKPKFHISKESFDAADFGFHFSSADTMLIKTGSGKSSLRETDEGFEYEETDLKILMYKDNMKVKKLIYNKGVSSQRKIGYIAEYIFLYNKVRTYAPFN